MTQLPYSRRAVLGGLATTGMMMFGVGRVLAAAEPALPTKPLFAAPPGACDCHHHIYDNRFPFVPGARLTPAHATVADYRVLQRRLGTTRNVIVTPSAYGTDNACLLDALAQMGHSARGIAVIDPSISDAALADMHARGVRGIRVLFGRTNPVRPQDIELLAQRIHPLGWHMQFYMPAAQLVELSDRLLTLPTPVVFDHMGHVPQPAGVTSDAYKVVRRALDSGRGWVKLSGAYMDTRVGPPGYGDTSQVARSYLAAAPERVVWGSNWPHPAAQAGETPVPDDLSLFNLLGQWAPSEQQRSAILVDNPAVLFGFQTL
ncbi:amidohydrolase family protein [Pseudomonas abieticivorans]|uniref:amidohydrolase family protein n=1 Tax=Pseudomonas abieticivorans TaxID=2931382 RepID=UPI0020BFB52E|nr:amidohydrolase family protein [Pseudomonas sp. PIA16]